MVAGQHQAATAILLRVQGFVCWRCTTRRFLFSTSSEAPLSASVTAFCSRCWRDLPEDEIERIN